MSFRDTNQSTMDVVRDMKDEIEAIRRDMGGARQNSIRLGNWVISADGNNLSFYNTVTKEEHGFGGREVWSFADQVSTDANTVDGEWVYPPYDVTLTSLTLTLQKPSTKPTEVRTVVNETEVAGGAVLLAGQNSVVQELNVNVNKTDRYWPRLSAPEGDGEMLAIIYKYSLTINTPNTIGRIDYGVDPGAAT